MALLKGVQEGRRDGPTVARATLEVALSIPEAELLSFVFTKRNKKIFPLIKDSVCWVRVHLRFYCFAEQRLLLSK